MSKSMYVSRTTGSKWISNSSRMCPMHFPFHHRINALARKGSIVSSCMHPFHMGSFHSILVIFVHVSPYVQVSSSSTTHAHVASAQSTRNPSGVSVA